MLDYPTAPFNFPTMLATTPAVGPTTLVAINGMLPTTPGGTPLTPNPGTFFAMSSALGSPNFITNHNLSSGPFIFPSTFPPVPSNLPCTATPFSSPQFQGPVLPFLSTAPTAMLTTNSPISLTPQFTSPLPHLLQQQIPGAPLAGYPSSLSATSVVTPLSAQPSLFTDPSSVGTNTVSSAMLPGSLPPNSVVFSSIPLSFSSSSASSASDVLVFPMTAPASTTGTTNLTAVSPLPLSSTYLTSTVSTISATLPSSTTASICTETQSCPSTVSTSIAPNLQSSFKIDKTQPMVPGGSAVRPSNNLLQLESMDFHRDEILDAIDKLRERKARPDFERISCMLKRYRNINPDQTQVCLGRLAAAGAVVCVDYKGNLSYRNPSKWRKTATRSGITNLPSVSAKLVDAVRRLMAGTVYQANVCGSDQAFSSLMPTVAGPNGGYSLFQIERALQVAEVTNTDSSNSQTSRRLSLLTGATLRVCLDREATHGKLAKTPDGRYVLDESGERKRLSSISVAAAPYLLNKKPLPPSGSTFVSPTGGNVKYNKPPTTMAHIAPAGDPATRPIVAKQSSASVSIAPLGGGPMNPLLGLSTRSSGSNRRGRPPGSKSRKYSLQADASAPTEKKIKIEAPPASTTPPTPDTSSPIGVSSIMPPTSGQTLTVANILTPKPNSAPPVISVNQNGFCPVPTSLNLHQSFVADMTQSHICSTVLPSPLLPTSFQGNQFLAYSTCPSVPASCSGSVPQTFIPAMPSGLSCDFSTLPKPSSSANSPAITLLSDLGSGNLYYGTDEKSPNDGLCCHCGAPPTKEEVFLICKDCGLRAHPTCLDYWPELTERARQSPWQCTDCKTCTVCQNKQITTDLLVCDACDKGFHIECHVPKLEEPVDRSLPWVCAECRKEGYSVAIGTLPGESDSKYEDSTNFGTEEGGSLHHNEDEARCSQDENETNDESQLSETGNLCSSKVEDLREDQELVLKGEVRTMDRGAEVTSPSTSPTPTPNYLSESNRLTTPDSTVQSVSPSPEAPVMRQHTPQERCSSSDGQRSTPRQRRDSSSSEQSRTPDTGNCSRLDSNLKHLEQLTHANTDELPTVRDQTTMDAYDTGDTGREFPQDTAHYRPPDVRAWSVEHVREWLLEEGFPREAEAFCQQEIDGACLLLMKRMDVLTELGIKLGPAVKIYERIKRLQSGCTSPTLLSA
ncbi:hypothetical protein CRM22_006765 [Opisthorchis felineus]|uniref:Histone acetyltransferase n=1 Tax=Opisthorchis felineus TaxID=147828 RepID=A0A4S2LSB1_OPIFE|nr:hypothetical protein CRM22_006765 [Opisthorchis felineus]